MKQKITHLEKKIENFRNELEDIKNQLEEETQEDEFREGAVKAAGWVRVDLVLDCGTCNRAVHVDGYVHSDYDEIECNAGAAYSNPITQKYLKGRGA